MKLTEDIVKKLFSDCSLTQKELLINGPKVPFVPIKSISIWYGDNLFFSKERINLHKKEIMDVLDSFPGIEWGQELYSLVNDRDGKRWCNNFFVVQQLVDLAYACRLIKYYSFSKKGSMTTMVVRDRTNDNIKIEGYEPALYSYLPLGCIPKKCEVSKKEIINYNNLRLAKELAMFIKIINQGLAFFGIKASINQAQPYQIAFYDQDNRFLYRHNFDKVKNMQDIYNYSLSRYNCQFKDKKGNSIFYGYDALGDKHLFRMNSAKKSLEYSFEIGMLKGQYSSVNLCIVDKDADFTLQKFSVNGHRLMIEINNRDGKYQDQEKGVLRRIVYDKEPISEDTFLTFDEFLGKDGHHASLHKFSLVIDNAKYTSSLPLDDLGESIIFHPHNQKFIQYAFDLFNDELHGLKNFLFDNFPLCQELLNVKEDYSSEDVEEIMDKIIYESCNVLSHDVKRYHLTEK